MTLSCLKLYFFTATLVMIWPVAFRFSSKQKEKRASVFCWESLMAYWDLGFKKSL